LPDVWVFQWFQVFRRISAAAGHRKASQIETETNSSPQSSQPPAHRAYGLRPGGRTLRKKILNNLCALRVLCGEILLENGIEIHEVSYERRLWPRASSLIKKETF
jgi:hypothetical protein